MGNLVDHLLPNPTVRVNAPEGLLHKCFVLSDGPSDDSGGENLLVGVLNVAGAVFEHGQEVAPPTRISYPALAGSVEIVVRCDISEATYHSPDRRDMLPLEVVQLRSTSVVKLDMADFNRFGFILLDRGGGQT